MEQSRKNIHFIHGIVYAFAFTCIVVLLRFMCLSYYADYGSASTEINAFAGLGQFFYILRLPVHFAKSFMIVWPCFEIGRTFYNHIHSKANRGCNDDLYVRLILPVSIFLIGIALTLPAAVSNKIQKDRFAAASNPDTEQADLLKIYEVAKRLSDNDLLAFIAQHSNASPEVLKELANDSYNFWIRTCVAANPSTPVELLEEMMNDNDTRVSDAARENPSLTKYQDKIGNQ